MSSKAIKNALEQAHIFAQNSIKAGDVVVDATAGNGKDTLFLAKLVGDNGKVYAFDIQEIAIHKTRELIYANNMIHRVFLINDGHENIKKHIGVKIKAAVFNLGYLPGGDHSIGTRKDTTIMAVQNTLDLLQKNGVVIIVIYHGGDTGFEERDALLQYVAKLDGVKFTVMKTEFINQVNYPPILLCIEKIAES